MVKQGLMEVRAGRRTRGVRVEGAVLEEVQISHLISAFCQPSLPENSKPVIHKELRKCDIGKVRSDRR